MKRIAPFALVAGTGKWCPVPMPAHPRPGDTDRNAVVTWVLGGER